MKTITIRGLGLSACLILLSACGGGGGGGGGNSVTVSNSTSAPELPTVTWYSAAQPLIERYCVSCHRDGGVAPFPLETYDQVLSKRSALVYSLETDTMPPLGFMDLADTERQLLIDWANQGAPKGDLSQIPEPAPAGVYTYHADIRPLLEKHCISCHVEGGIAPFPLDTFDDVRGVSAAITYSLEQGTMPPWPPTSGYTRIENDRLLSDEEKYVLLTWLASDMPEGNPADYQPSTSGPVDDPDDYNLKLQLPQPYTPIVQPDDHRCFAIEWPEDEFTYVTAVSVIPDQEEEVHHVIVSVAEPEDAATYYAEDGKDGHPGWYCLGAGGVRGAPLPRQIGGWVPGAGRDPTPTGTGIGVKPGSVLVVQMHYNTLVAEPAPDQSTVLIRTATEVERPASGFLLTDPNFLSEGGMPVPANDPDVRHEFTVPAGALALIFGEEAGVERRDSWAFHQTLLHMHNLGTSGRVTLLRENGTRQVLLDVRDWDFNWQGTYQFEREVLIQHRDKIKLECSWDNSQANQPFVNGEQLQSRYVEWGDGTQDEMCLMSVLMTQPKEGYDYSYHPSVHIEAPTYRQQFRPGDLVPLRLILNNFELHDPGEHNHSDPAMHMISTHDGEGDDHGGVYSGHYHVYLDTDDDDAGHLTAWDDEYYYQLPEVIDEGLHELRVSLRGQDHHALGIEDTATIEVVAGDSREAESLVAVEDWREQSTEEDSLADRRPDNVVCPSNSWYEEDGALEVETGYCNYLSLTQLSKTDVRAGDQLHIVLWHGDLVFDEPAKGHVSVSVAGNVVWEAQVDIPAEAEIFDVTIPVNFDAPAGTKVEYHVQNHGYNTWSLLRMEVLR